MAHTPGPWTACHDGKCKCKFVSGEHHPIAQIISGEWGDDYPNVRLVTSQRNIGQVAEAYIDRIVYGEVDEETARDNACLIAAVLDLLAVCESVASRPAEAQEMMRREGFAIDDLEDRWQKLAFTLYTYLVADATQAQAAIAKSEGEDENDGPQV